MDKITIQRQIPAVDPNGKNIVLDLAIGTPYMIDKDEWRCPVKIDGYNFILPDMPGVDSWGAFREAYRIVLDLLTDFVEKGGKLKFGTIDVSSNEIAEYF